MASTPGTLQAGGKRVIMRNSKISSLKARAHRILNSGSLILVLTALLPWQNLTAQPQGAPPLSLPQEEDRKPLLRFEAPKTEKELPAVGEPFTVKVNLTRTKDTHHLLRAYIVKDGKYEERTIGNAYLNEFDIPTYDVEFHSPQADLEMQFLVSTEEHKNIWSRAHQVSRRCITDPQISDLSAGVGAAVKDRMPILIAQADSLEAELRGYENALELIERLNQQLVQEDQQ